MLPTRQYTVVCLEDDHDLAQLIKLALAPWEVTIHMAYDGVAGLALIRTHQPDLILLDMGLPGLSGWDICYSMRDDPILSTIPVIVLTAVPPPAQITLFSQIATYKIKPFTLGELRTMVRAVLPAVGAH